jgi:hypothetical protein
MIKVSEVKKGLLVRSGTTLGIVLQEELKFNHHNHYAWVYYFDSKYHEVNPGWVFLHCINRVEK